MDKSQYQLEMKKGKDKDIPQWDYYGKDFLQHALRGFRWLRASFKSGGFKEGEDVLKGEAKEWKGYKIPVCVYG